MAEQHTLTGEHSHWETGVKGLQRRHVKRIHVEWEDKPPSDIAEQRLRDITAAMRLGFEQVDLALEASETRARLGTKVASPPNTEPAPMVTKHTPEFLSKHAEGLAGSQED